jgi:Methyltransferase domain
MKIHIHHFQSREGVADAAALEQFQKQWSTYQKLVDSDVLSHKEVGKILHDTLKSLPRPFAFVDIACGDAGQMKGALAGTKVNHYHGIDLSEPALQLAAKNLKGVPFAVELDHRDFVEALERRPEPADVAWCGLSIHHLSTEDKLELLKALHGSTSKLLMIYEPTLADGEDREGFVARFCRVNRPAWTFLTKEEWAQIEHHAAVSDRPESAAGWLELGHEAGFSAAREVFRDPTGFYRVYRYDH